jgi:Flp pilus assembly protein TadG
MEVKEVKKQSREAGQSVVLMMLVCMTVLLGFAGLATDVGTLFRGKRNVQTAADSAAIAGALELSYGDWNTAARTDATKNGFTDGVNGATVTVHNPPTFGPHLGNANYVEVLVAQAEPTFFMNLFGWHSMKVLARAVAYPGPGQGCVYALGSATTDFMSGSLSLSLPQCGMSINSGFNFSGSGTITADWTGVTGSYTHSGTGTITPAPVTGVVPASDPLAYLVEPTPVGTCQPNPNVSGVGTVTLNPPSPAGKAYCGITISGSPTVTFNPGTYIVQGGLNWSGTATINGTNVTFYVTSGGAINISGTVNLNLSAPTSGTYNGILFFQDRTDSSALNISGATASVLKGIIYAPDATLNYSGSGSTNIYVTLVVNAFNLSGSGKLQDYAALPGVTSPVSKVTLVE